MNQDWQPREYGWGLQLVGSTDGESRPPHFICVVFYHHSDRRPHTGLLNKHILYFFQFCRAAVWYSLVGVKTRVSGGLLSFLESLRKDPFSSFSQLLEASPTLWGLAPAVHPQSRQQWVSSLHVLTLTLSASLCCSEPWGSRWVHPDDPGHSPYVKGS